MIILKPLTSAMVLNGEIIFSLFANSRVGPELTAKLGQSFFREFGSFIGDSEKHMQI